MHSTEHPIKINLKQNCVREASEKDNCRNSLMSKFPQGTYKTDRMYPYLSRGSQRIDTRLGCHFQCLLHETILHRNKKTSTAHSHTFLCMELKTQSDKKHTHWNMETFLLYQLQLNIYLKQLFISLSFHVGSVSSRKRYDSDTS